jgi:hypothetical protein
MVLWGAPFKTESMLRESASTYPRIILVLAIMSMLALAFLWVFNRPADTIPGSFVDSEVTPETGIDSSSRDRSSRISAEENEGQTQPETLADAGLPSLDESDTSVSLEVANVIDSVSYRALLPLIPKTHVLRRWVALLSSAAGGKLPMRLREFARLSKEFSPDKVGAQWVLGTSSYMRYDFLLDIVTSVDVERLAKRYRFWSPAIETAYLELGEGGGSAHARLLAVLDRLIEVRPVNKQVLELEHMYGNLYRYKDPDLESVDAISKLLWRSGKDNMLRLQKWCMALKQALQ